MSAACSAPLLDPVRPGAAGPGRNADRAPGPGRLAPAHEPLLPGLAATLDGEERAAFEALRAAWHARATPADAAERAVVDVIAACVFRLSRLDAVEAVLTRRLIEGGSTAGLPALATLVRARAGLARDQARAEADLMHLRDIRPRPLRYPGLTPARLRWLAARLEEGRIGPWAPPSDTAAEAAAETAPAAAPGDPVHAAPEPAPRHGGPERASAQAGLDPASAPAAPEPALLHAGPDPASPHTGPATAGASAGPGVRVPADARLPARPAAPEPGLRGGASDPAASGGDASAGGASPGSGAQPPGTVPSSQRASTATGSSR